MLSVSRLARSGRGRVALLLLAASATPTARPAALLSAFRVSLHAPAAPGPRLRYHDEGFFGLPFAAAFAPALAVTLTDQILGDHHAGPDAAFLGAPHSDPVHSDAQSASGYVLTTRRIPHQQ